MELNVEQVKDFIKGMSLLQAAELVKQLEEELGVSAAAPMGMMAMPAGAAGGAAAAEEQTEFTVILAEVPADKKINVIKVVREITALGLKEAKDLVEGAPKPVKEGVSKDEAKTIETKLKEAGATVKLQ